MSKAKTKTDELQDRILKLQEELEDLKEKHNAPLRALERVMIHIHKILADKALELARVIRSNESDEVKMTEMQIVNEVTVVVGELQLAAMDQLPEGRTKES